LADLQHHSLPALGTENISILQKVWKVKSIPPFLKTFAWRLIRRALTAAERDGRYSTHIDRHCIHCGAIENDAYLLFLLLPSQNIGSWRIQILCQNIRSCKDKTKLNEVGE
jgi:hypothetical protein